MPFYKITIELAGKTTTGIREHRSDTDSAFQSFRNLAEKAYGSRMLYFDCVQLSTFSDELKLFLKKKGKTGKTFLAPVEEDDYGLPVDNTITKPQASRKESVNRKSSFKKN